MTPAIWVQLFLYVGVLLALVKPLGRYMARVYLGEHTLLRGALRSLEALIYRIGGINEKDEMDWKGYAAALFGFNLLGLVFLYLLLRLQHLIPLNPPGLPAISPNLAFNIAASFVTNTNWQSYSGETTLSFLSQAFGLTVQNFLSAGTGMAALLALARGIARHTTSKLGNFWVDLTRSIVYILLPLSILLALLLVSQGVVQTFKSYTTVQLLEPYTSQAGQFVTTQDLPLGPAASQIAIKQLGTNGGGFYNVNSAHPFENPTPVSNFLEMLAILLIPAALTYTYGKMIGDTRQGWAILAAMAIVFVMMLGATIYSEQAGNPALAGLGVDQSTSGLQPGGNMEGKELRFGILSSALWATATTAASNGSVNALHDSFMPLGGLTVMWLMQLGEVIFGGVGSGLYGMLAFVIVAVFVSGLMVGRTPEYMGKKIEVFEMKMSALVVLIPVLVVLVGTATALSIPAARTSIFNSGPQGFSEVLYAFSSAANNNGSAFAGLNANTPFYNIALGIAMLLGRFGLILPVLAMAGSLAAKKRIPPSAGTLPTHTPLFIGWLIAVVIIVGALSYLPSLALGPIIQQLLLGTGKLF